MASHSSPPEKGPRAEHDSITPGQAKPGPGEGKSTGSAKNALSGFLAARIELASIEAREAAAYAGKKAVLGIVLGVMAFFCWALVLAGLVGLLAPMAESWFADKASWLPGWAAVLFGLALLHGAVALICLACLRQKPPGPLFELSRKEIENDKQWLAKNK